MKRTDVNWLAVAVFYVVACAISWPTFWWRDMDRDGWKASKTPGVVKALLPALGPALAAILTLVLFRKSHRRTVTFFGSSWRRSLIFTLVPLACLTIVGIGDDEPHLTALLFGVVYLLYALGEEMGWRGFLQDALRPLPPLRRYALIGVLWGAWHFTTFAGGGLSAATSKLSFMLVLWILGSWGIGEAVEKSHSLLVAAPLHLTFNFAEALSRTSALLVLVPSIITWVAVMRGWRPMDESGLAESDGNEMNGVQPK